MDGEPLDAVGWRPAYCRNPRGMVRTRLGLSESGASGASTLLVIRSKKAGTRAATGSPLSRDDEKRRQIWSQLEWLIRGRSFTAGSADAIAECGSRMFRQCPHPLGTGGANFSCATTYPLIIITACCDCD
jgi:hypothetical protein